MRQDRRTFIRQTAFVSGAITLRSFSAKGQSTPGTALSSTTRKSEDAAGESIRQQFQSPAKKYRPLARWWWPGNDVTDEELRREIDVLEKAGFGGAEIQPFNKGFAIKDESQMRLVNSYATPSFFSHVGVAAEEALKHDMFIDYTFGSGWPFGGGIEITPELASIELRSTHQSIEGPAKFHQQLQIPSVTDGDLTSGSSSLNGLPDGWAERLRKRTKVVAVVAVRGHDAHWERNQGGGRDRAVSISGELEAGTSVDLTANLQADGTLEWDVPPGTWQLFVFCSLPTVQRVNAGAGEGPQLVMDHMSSDAFAAHAKRVGNDAIPIIGKFFGNGLRAMFCDSLEVRANLFWSDDFLAEFRRRRGYDLVPYLPILKVRGYAEPFGQFVDVPVFEIADIGNQVRHDYRQTVSDLMTERFYGQFNKWAHDHKLLSRTQAHGAPAEVLRIYGEADIPETENLFDQGCYDFLKMAASAAHVYGRPIVGSESFVWSNAAYETTPEKVKVAADELLTAGINAIVYHGFPYIMPGIPAPGWHPFTGFGEGNYSSQFNELNPFWQYFGQINSYITRLQYISQVGVNIAAVAIYRNDLAHGADEFPPTPKLNQAIMDAGYNYDHINADSLLHCSIRDKMLISTGGAQYGALILPPLDAIDASLAEQLHSFASAGLPIVFFGQIPSRAEGLRENARESQRVQTALRSLRNLHNVYFSTDVEGIVSLLKQVANPNLKFHGKALSFFQKRIGKMNAFFLPNDSDTKQHLDVDFQAEGLPELWDLWTGQTTSLAGSRKQDGWVEVQLDLQPLSSALIVFDPDGVPPAIASSPVRSLSRTKEIGDGGWKLTATGFVSSGETATISRNLPMLIDWSLDTELRGFSGRGVYSSTFTVDRVNDGEQAILDLGNVRDVAEVSVNGKPAGTLLLRPYQVDVTQLIHSGENELQITVTNALFNNMMSRKPRTFRPGPAENPSGLMPAGLIGPVQLKFMD